MDNTTKEKVNKEQCNEDLCEYNQFAKTLVCLASLQDLQNACEELYDTLFGADIPDDTDKCMCDKEEAKAKYNKKLDFSDVFEKQAENQREMLKKGMYLNFSDMTKEQMYLIELPIDDTKICSYHVQQLMSEIGELLDADKRWKNFRNTKNNQKDKLEELADCFIELMNIAMFSGYDYNNVLNAIAKKVNKVHNRISNEK